MGKKKKRKINAIYIITFILIIIIISGLFMFTRETGLVQQPANGFEYINVELEDTYLEADVDKTNLILTIKPLDQVRGQRAFLFTQVTYNDKIHTYYTRIDGAGLITERIELTGFESGNNNINIKFGAKDFSSYSDCNNQNTKFCSGYSYKYYNACEPEKELFNGFDCTAFITLFGEKNSLFTSPPRYVEAEVISHISGLRTSSTSLSLEKENYRELPQACIDAGYTTLTECRDNLPDVINGLETDIEEKIKIINQLELLKQEKIDLITDLELTLDEQAEIINSIKANIEEKAELIDKLTAETDEQAELIKAMKLSFAEQGQIIALLENTIGEDADLIEALSGEIDEQAEIISNMELNNEEQLKLINELKQSNTEKDKLIEKLQQENVKNIIIILTVIASIMLLVLLLVARNKRKKTKKRKRR